MDTANTHQTKVRATERKEPGAEHLHLQSVLVDRGALSLCENRASFVQHASLDI